MSSPLGRPIRVGMFEHDPDAFNCFRQVPVKNCRKPGAEVEIIKIVMDMLQWDWEIVDTEKNFGVLNDFGNIQPDGNFSGIMGLLANDLIDMGGISMRITPERMKVAHFTFPIRYFQQVYIINRPGEYDYRNFIFASFSTMMWFYLLVVIIGVSLLRFLIAMLVDRKPGPKTNVFSNGLLETVGIMLKQRVLDPTAATTMVLHVFLIISMMFISQYYQTSMNSKLTAPNQPAIPFYHQSELIDLFVKGKAYPTYYFNVQLEGSTVENAERLEEYWKTNPVKTHSTKEEIVQEIKQGGIFYSTYDVELLPDPVSSWDRKEGLTVIRDTTGILSQVAYGFSYSNRRLCEKFNKALLTILPGISQITLGPGYAHKKEAENVFVEAKKTTLSLTKHLQQLFITYAIAIVCCVITLGTEVLTHRIHAKKKAIYQLEQNINETDQTDSM